METYTDNNLNGQFITQTDGYNYGPIACIIMWYMFTHDEVDLTIPVEQYRCKVVEKLKKMLNEVKEKKELMVMAKELVYKVPDSDPE